MVTDTPIAPTPAPVCWAMYPRPSRHGWANSVLIAPNGARYHLGHNGLRLSHACDRDGQMCSSGSPPRSPRPHQPTRGDETVAFSKEQKRLHRQKPAVREKQAAYKREWDVANRRARTEYQRRYRSGKVGGGSTTTPAPPTTTNQRDLFDAGFS